MDNTMKTPGVGIKRPPRPPRHLSREMRRWFSHVVATWQLEPQDILVLTAAAEAWDNARAARRELEKAGRYFVDKFGAIRAHPAVAVEANARRQFLQALRQLGLDIEAPGPVGRPGGK